MQRLHPCRGSIPEYLQVVLNPKRHRLELDHCSLCEAPGPLRRHGFYFRTVVDLRYEGTIPVQRYLCLRCRRTISLLPEFALPYLRFGIVVIGLFLVARLLHRRTLAKAALAASQPKMPYQRAQFWVRRFRRQAEALCAALSSLTAVTPASDFRRRALQMLEAIGWRPAHRFLLGQLRMHLLGWPPFLAPHGLRINISPASSSS
jgi:transposase-like protein